MNKGIIVGIIVVVIVVIAAAILLGITSTKPATTTVAASTSISPTSGCIAMPGFACGEAALSNGTLTAVVSQTTGAQWAQSNIFFVLSSSPAPTAVPPLPCEQGVLTSWPSGGTVNVTLNDYSNTNTCAGFNKTPGSTFTGTVWAGYRASINSTEQLVQIGTIGLTSS